MERQEVGKGLILLDSHSNYSGIRCDVAVAVSCDCCRNPSEPVGRRSDKKILRRQLHRQTIIALRVAIASRSKDATRGSWPYY